MSEPRQQAHARWVRVTHWLLAVSIFTLFVSGFVILMAHPRLYWGVAGNDLMPALLELPISPDYAKVSWADSAPMFDDASGPVSASRTYDAFNQNGWARSLHFLFAWWLVLVVAFYWLTGAVSGHLHSHIWPGLRRLSPQQLWRDLVDRFQQRAPAPPGPHHYGLLQKVAYSMVIFVLIPLQVLTGLTMSPRIAAALPWLLQVFGGFQSARTLHFAGFALLLLFVLVHIIMVIRSGLLRQLRAMTIGERHD
ncbi:MAG TPA: cytochrome b/b6 domain-containing protein [Candidatus Acidoferrum sp.]|nr:cytochrome b/b6 domain-containing protein [Candidatus Acidoferrum sp.]